MIKVMLIDDEPEIRKLLHKMVEKQDGYQVVSECGDFAGAVADFARYRPDVVFVDIDLNGEDGINCARVLTELNPKLKVIFATAHSEYMASAFEIYAFDYLVKPFNMERLYRTLERIRSSMAENACRDSAQSKIPHPACAPKDSETPAGSETLGAAAQNGTREKSDSQDRISRPVRYLGKLLIKGKEQTFLLDVDDILFIERVDGSSNIVTASGEQYKTSASLSDLEAKLDSDSFMRCHKSYIISLSRITRIEPYGRWTYVARFRDCESSALITAQKYEELKRLFL